MNIADKHILVTGSSGVLGEALIDKFRSTGARITAIDKIQNKQKQSDYPHINFQQIDINNYEEVKNYIECLRDKGDLPTVVIFNAAVHMPDNDPFIDFPKLNQSIQSNMLSILYFLSVFMPIQKSPTQFIFCSSGVIIFPNKEYFGYFLSKLAATKTFDLFDDRYRGYGYRFKSIILGPIQSLMLDKSKPPKLAARVLRELTSCKPHQAADKVCKLLGRRRKRLYYPKSSALVLCLTRILQAILPGWAKFYRA